MYKKFSTRLARIKNVNSAFEHERGFLMTMLLLYEDQSKTMEENDWLTNGRNKFQA